MYFWIELPAEGDLPRAVRHRIVFEPDLRIEIKGVDSGDKPDQLVLETGETPVVKTGQQLLVQTKTTSTQIGKGMSIVKLTRAGSKEVVVAGQGRKVVPGRPLLDQALTGLI